MTEVSLVGHCDAAVRARTGKSWSEWFALLDAAGAHGWEHKRIAAYLAAEAHCPDWWSQMVTVTYEQERGLRARHQTPSGYQVSRSLTLAVRLDTLYRAWEDERTRRRWLKAGGYVARKATPQRSVRLAWDAGRTSVDISFYAKGPAKSQIAVQHTKLADAAAVERLRAFWAAALARLKQALESPD